MNGTFNSNRFEELNRQISSKKAEITDALENIAAACSWSSSTYRSEDSALSSTYETLQVTVKKAQDKAGTLLTSLLDSLVQYMNETMANEAETQKALSGVNEVLESASNAIDAL